MDELTFEALTKYFNHLSNVGYFKQTSVERLLALIIIQEVLHSDFKDVISTEDNNLINKALHCLYGSNCLIPYPDYYKSVSDKIMY